jgi:hypothetical protein
VAAACSAAPALKRDSEALPVVGVRSSPSPPDPWLCASLARSCTLRPACFSRPRPVGEVVAAPTARLSARPSAERSGPSGSPCSPRPSSWPPPRPTPPNKL